MLYPVVLTPYGDSVLVSFPDIPEALTLGDNVDDALRHAADAGESALDFYYEANKPLPVPSPLQPGQCLVELPVRMGS